MAGYALQGLVKGGGGTLPSPPRSDFLVEGLSGQRPLLPPPTPPHGARSHPSGESLIRPCQSGLTARWPQ